MEELDEQNKNIEKEYYEMGFKEGKDKASDEAYKGGFNAGIQVTNEYIFIYFTIINTYLLYFSFFYHILVWFRFRLLYCIY